jgi:hypothetical protein
MTEEAAADTTDDGGYVHDPSDFDHDDGGSDGTAGGTSGGAAGEDTIEDAHGVSPGDLPREDAREFDWRGWTLVAMVFLAFVVIPAMLYFLPRAQGFVASLGLSLRDAFLVLPLLPAILLGAMAVWATTRP